MINEGGLIVEQQGLSLPTASELEALIDTLDLDSLRQTLAYIHPADIADLLDGLTA